MDKNARNLIIVESPNKVKTLTKIFKDAGYKNTLVMASVGHIANLASKSKTGYKNTGVDVNNGFKVKYVINKDKEHIVEDLKLQVKAADHVYICSDPDREGEAIAWELKKFLGITEKGYSRATFHEIIAPAVLKALDNPRKIDNDLVSAAHTRRILDRLVGYLPTNVIRSKVGATSVGRCQSAGLKIIADREKEVQAFVAETYWELFLNFTKDGEVFKAKYVGTPTEEIQRFTSSEAVSKVYAECKAPYTIESISQEDRYSYPKPPFITSTFLQEVSTKLGIPVKLAKTYAQRLFEGLNINGEHIALITYIRTDSAELAPEFLPVLKDHVLSEYGKDYYADVAKAKNSALAQDGHEAIRPVDMSMTPDKLSKYITDKSLLKVYELIYRRTEACAMKPSITAETTYIISSGQHRFKLVTRELKFDGYKKAYIYKEDTGEDESGPVVFKLKEQIADKNNPGLEITKKSTKPPVRFKEATFIKELEKLGIGRPSTYDNILDTLKDELRGYCVEDEKGYLVPTELGMKLSNFLDDAFSDIFNLNYTAEMESDLDLIANHKLNDVDFLTELFNKLTAVIKDSYKKESVKPQAVILERTCPECGKPLAERFSKYGRFVGCTGYPKCSYIERGDSTP